MSNVVVAEAPSVSGEVYLDIVKAPPADLFARVLDFGLEDPSTSAEELISGVFATYDSGVELDGRWVLDILDRLEAAGFVYVDPIARIVFDQDAIKKKFRA